MEIATTSPQQPALPEKISSTSQISSDFETFLKMLTAQIENQDPLNPIDSSDYAVQLATFSSVEQQVQTNDLLRALTGTFNTTNIAEFANWVGKEVRTSAPVTFEGSAITIYPTIETGAERAVLIVRDGQGNTVSEADIPVDGQPIKWAGVNADGSPFFAGTYAFQVQSYSADDLLGSNPAETYQAVTEVRKSADGNTVIVLSNQTEVKSDGVTALRTPLDAVP